jgi:5-methylcytosine-specific restriction protein A
MTKTFPKDNSLVTIDGKKQFIYGGGRTKDRDIRTNEDKRQDAILERLEPKPQEFRDEAEYKRFYASKEWRLIRETAFKDLMHSCPVCWSDENLVVDHIKPVRYYWEERLNPNNLQILCNDCNREKGAMTNWTLEWHKLLKVSQKRYESQYKPKYFEERKIPLVESQSKKPFVKTIQRVKKDGTIVK